MLRHGLRPDAHHHDAPGRLHGRPARADSCNEPDRPGHESLPTGHTPATALHRLELNPLDPGKEPILLGHDVHPDEHRHDHPCRLHGHLARDPARIQPAGHGHESLSATAATTAATAATAAATATAATAATAAATATAATAAATAATVHPDAVLQSARLLPGAGVVQPDDDDLPGTAGVYARSTILL